MLDNLKQVVESVNVGVPQTFEFGGKTIETSMLKTAIPEIAVSFTSIDGDRFANANFHGTPDSLLYAYGRDAMAPYAGKLGRSLIVAGELGENITLAQLDEAAVSVGDRFKIGTVLAEATFPRIPCTKLNFVFQNSFAQRAMIEVGRSGIYFRILEAGVIRAGDSFERVSRAKTEFTIADVYRRMVGPLKLSAADYSRALDNGAFPADRLEKWSRIFA